MKRIIAAVLSAAILALCFGCFAEGTEKTVFIPADPATVESIKLFDRSSVIEQWDDDEKCQKRLSERIGCGIDNGQETAFVNAHDTVMMEDLTVLTLQKSGSYDKILFYIHGGAYVYGAYSWQLSYVDEIVSRTGVKAVVPMYKLAPDYTYRDTFTTLLKIYLTLREEGKEIILSGDSAGGGLAMAFIHYLNQNNAALPEKMILHSPWADVTMENEAVESYRDIEAMLPKHYLVVCGKAWAGDKDTRDPIISPLYGSFDHMPKTLLFTATDEIFYPDIMAMYEKMVAANADITLVTIEKGYHVISVQEGLKESEQCRDIAADFIMGE